MIRNDARGKLRRFNEVFGMIYCLAVVFLLLLLFFINATQLLTLQYKKNTVLCCNNKYYLQWGTNTTKIQIRISLTVHWYIYNTFLIFLAKLLHRRERERKGKKNYIYKYINEKRERLR